MNNQQHIDKILLKKATHRRLMDFSDSELRRVFTNAEELARFKQIIGDRHGKH